MLRQGDGWRVGCYSPGCDITRNARMAADDALHADAETIEITFAQKKEPYSQRFFRASDARTVLPCSFKSCDWQPVQSDEGKLLKYSFRSLPFISAWRSAPTDPSPPASSGRTGSGSATAHSSGRKHSQVGRGLRA